MHPHARSWSPLLVALVLVVGGCQPGDSGTGGSRLGFRPGDTVVDFGRVLEGAQARRAVTVLATGRASLTVTASVDAPFALVTSEVGVPGGGATEVEVVFTAGHGPSEGTLVLSGAGLTASVRLTGLGIRPTPCPERPCHESRFDVATGTCVETSLEEGAACTPDSRCQVDGRCQAGVCVGRPRTCDDNNPCTVDACSPTQGCVTTRAACPVPENPCKVGVCDRDEGCTAVDADDFSPCGPVDCQTARLCFSGTCRAVTPPEGFVCAPATACQGEGTCQRGVCQRPDPVELEPELSLELEGVPVDDGSGAAVLLVSEDALFTSVCGGDGGCQLVAYTRSGLLRYAAPYPDGGARTLLAASDAGVVVQAPDGMEAYAQRGTGTRLWQASWASLGAGEGTTAASHVALTQDEDVLAYVAWQSTPDAGGVDGGTAPDSARLVWLTGGADAGTLLGASRVEAWRGEARLGVDAEGVAYLYTGDGRLVRVDVAPGPAAARDERRAFRGANSCLRLNGMPAISDVNVDARSQVPQAAMGTDGTTELMLSSVVDGGIPDGGASLAIAGGRLLVGARALVPGDGGAPVLVMDGDGGTAARMPIAEPALLSPAGLHGYLFARACARTDGMPCSAQEERVVLRAVNPESGHVVWEVDALPNDTAPGKVYEAALFQGDAVGVLAGAELPEGHQTWIQFFARGARVGSCPLPEHPNVAGAAFQEHHLYVVLSRNGVWRLEAYRLGKDFRAEERGWPQRHGSSARSRSESP
ncbi:hypothetical protein ACLEPN_29885 [Myxococcus sp. 1LA]